MVVETNGPALNRKGPCYGSPNQAKLSYTVGNHS